MMEWFIFWLIINCVVGYLIGQQKNDVATAIVLSILLGPIGWLIAALSSGNLRKCPHCAEFVKPEATVCRHCGKELPEFRPIPELPMPKSSNLEREIALVPLRKGEKIAWAAFLAAIAIAVIIAAFYLGAEKKPEKLHHEINPAAPQSRISETPQETYYLSLRLTRSVELKNSIGRVIVKLQSGQS